MQLDQVDAIYTSFNAFTVLVSRPIVAGFRKRGKNRKQPSAPGFFGNKAAGHKGLKRRLGGKSPFSPHLRKHFAEVCGKIKTRQTHYTFTIEEPQVKALTLCHVVGSPGFYRILPNSESPAVRIKHQTQG